MPTPETPSSAAVIDPQEFYRLLVDHAAVALVATDAQFHIVAWNAAATELLGRNAESMIGRSLAELVPPERVRVLERLLDRTARRGQTRHVSLRMAGRDDAMKHVAITLSPIPAPGGGRGVAAWIVDETSRREHAERVAQAERVTSLGTFAGGVAHHLNTILGGVAAFVDYALTSGDSKAMKRALQMTAEATARVHKITQSLLSFAKQDSQEDDLADLTEVVLTFAHLVERPLAERRIRLKLDVQSVPILAIDANRMHQVLGYLLSNAEESMPDGGTLALGLDHDGQCVRLTFADTGCGIRPEHLGLVFEPFFTTKGVLAGDDRVNPGLGLSAAHGMIVAMGGQVQVASAVGKGTTFTLTFPIPLAPNHPPLWHARGTPGA